MRILKIALAAHIAHAEIYFGGSRGEAGDGSSRVASCLSSETVNCLSVPNACTETTETALTIEGLESIALNSFALINDPVGQSYHFVSKYTRGDMGGDMGDGGNVSSTNMPATLLLGLPLGTKRNRFGCIVRFPHYDLVLVHSPHESMEKSLARCMEEEQCWVTLKDAVIVAKKKNLVFASFGNSAEIAAKKLIDATLLHGDGTRTQGDGSLTGGDGTLPHGDGTRTRGDSGCKDEKCAESGQEDNSCLVNVITHLHFSIEGTSSGMTVKCEGAHCGADRPQPSTLLTCRQDSYDLPRHYLYIGVPGSAEGTRELPIRHEIDVPVTFFSNLNVCPRPVSPSPSRVRRHHRRR